MTMRYRRKATRRKAKKKDRSFADYIVFISIGAVSVFTIAAFILQFKGLMEISSTLTTCWFAFWTVEIVALAAIRTSKVKNEYDKTKETEEENNG